MKLTDTGGGDFEPPPAGSHVARCVQVIDIGTQHWEYQGKPKATRKIRLTFELPFETKVFDEAKGPEPLLVSGEWTASLNERANLRKLLASWRGRDFTEDELQGFEARKLLDQAAMVTIVHDKKGSKTYANITGIAKPPKGPQYEAPAARTNLIFFSLDPEEFDERAYKQLPEWLQKKIADSDEFKEMSAPTDQRQPSGGPVPPVDDEIPF